MRQVSAPAMLIGISEAVSWMRHSRQKLKCVARLYLNEAMKIMSRKTYRSYSTRLVDGNIYLASSTFSGPPSERYFSLASKLSDARKNARMLCKVRLARISYVRTTNTSSSKVSHFLAWYSDGILLNVKLITSRQSFRNLPRFFSLEWFILSKGMYLFKFYR